MTDLPECIPASDVFFWQDKVWHGCCYSVPRALAGRRKEHTGVHDSLYLVLLVLCIESCARLVSFPSSLFLSETSTDKDA